MGLLGRIRRALDKREVTKLKKRIDRLDIEATKQGKTVERLVVVMNPRKASLSVFEFVLSDGTTNKLQQPRKKTASCKKPNRVTPVVEKQIPSVDPVSKKTLISLTLVGKSRDYDEESVFVEEYEPGGYKVVLVVRRDGVRDILKVRCSGNGSVPQDSIWWIENKEKVCKKFSVTATPPPEAPLISFATSRLKAPKI